MRVPRSLLTFSRDLPGHPLLDRTLRECKVTTIVFGLPALEKSSTHGLLRETEGRIEALLAGMCFTFWATLCLSLVLPVLWATLCSNHVLPVCYKTWDNHLEERRGLFMAHGLGVSIA